MFYYPILIHIINGKHPFLAAFQDFTLFYKSFTTHFHSGCGGKVDIFCPLFRGGLYLRLMVIRSLLPTPFNCLVVCLELWPIRVMTQFGIFVWRNWGLLVVIIMGTFPCMA